MSAARWRRPAAGRYGKSTPPVVRARSTTTVPRCGGVLIRLRARRCPLSEVEPSPRRHQGGAPDNQPVALICPSSEAFGITLAKNSGYRLGQLSSICRDSLGASRPPPHPASATRRRSETARASLSAVVKNTQSSNGVRGKGKAGAAGEPKDPSHQAQRRQSGPPRTPGSTDCRPIHYCGFRSDNWNSADSDRPTILLRARGRLKILNQRSQIDSPPK